MAEQLLDRIRREITERKNKRARHTRRAAALRRRWRHSRPAELAARSLRGSRSGAMRLPGAPRGENRAKLLSAVADRPGATTAQLAQVTGISREPWRARSPSSLPTASLSARRSPPAVSASSTSPVRPRATRRLPKRARQRRTGQLIPARRTPPRSDRHRSAALSCAWRAPGIDLTSRAGRVRARCRDARPAPGLDEPACAVATRGDARPEDAVGGVRRP